MGKVITTIRSVMKYQPLEQHMLYCGMAEIVECMHYSQPGLTGAICIIFKINPYQMHISTSKAYAGDTLPESASL